MSTTTHIDTAALLAAYQRASTETNESARLFHAELLATKIPALVAEIRELEAILAAVLLRDAKPCAVCGNGETDGPTLADMLRDGVDGAMSAAHERVTVICGHCEHEWDADKFSPDGPCPSLTCGAEPGEHVIRVDGVGRRWTEPQ